MAQDTVEGCVEPSSQVVYTVVDTRKNLYIGPATDLSAECYSSSNSGTPCTICNGELNMPGNCKIPTISGTFVTFTIEDCPIDNSLFPLILVIGGLGFLSVRRINLSIG